MIDNCFICEGYENYDCAIYVRNSMIYIDKDEHICNYKLVANTDLKNWEQSKTDDIKLFNMLLSYLVLKDEMRLL